MTRKALMVVAVVLAFAVTASAWESLTHAYLMEMIKNGAGNTTNDERYGITGPDFFNFLLSSPYRSFLYDQTHEEFMRVWHMAGNGMKGTPEEALAMGFVCHNGVWGADLTAHYAALTENPAEGYVISKAIVLEMYLAAGGLWGQLGLGGDDPRSAAIRRELCHEIIEIIVDIQVWRLDKAIGGRYLQAVMLRDASFGELLGSAYAGVLAEYSLTTAAPIDRPAAMAVIGEAEAGYRYQMLYYASIFNTTDEAAVIAGLGNYLALLAQDGFGLPIDGATVAGLLQLVLSFNLTYDVEVELDATVDHVQEQLAANKVVYGPKGHLR